MQVISDLAKDVKGAKKQMLAARDRELDLQDRLARNQVASLCTSKLPQTRKTVKPGSCVDIIAAARGNLLAEGS